MSVIDVELTSDPIIRAHFAALYDNLLEQNLLRIVEPFSRVEVAHVASLVGLPVVEIEFKYSPSKPVVDVRLSQMILDRVFHGVLDHSAGCLIVFEEQGPDVFPSRYLFDCRKRMMRHWRLSST